MGLHPLEIFVPIQCGDRLHTSESNVYRRQILTSEDDPRTVMVKALLLETKYIFKIFNVLSQINQIYRGPKLQVGKKINEITLDHICAHTCRLNWTK